MISTIHQWKNAFVDNCVRFCAHPVADYTNHLTPLEREFVAKAVDIRQHTYSTGRFCAKTVLSEIGVTSINYPDGLLRQDDGSVAWPHNAAGSITHTNDWAMAAATIRGERYESIGIDIEKIDRVGKDILRIIATDQERELLVAEGELRWGRVALFSIKESLYKCLRPIYGEFINFKDVELTEFAKPLNEIQLASFSIRPPDIYTPTIQLLRPELAACCDERRLDVRLAVLDEHVISFVGYIRC